MAWRKHHPSSIELLLAGFRPYVPTTCSAESIRLLPPVAAQSNGITHGGLADTFSNYHDYTVS